MKRRILILDNDLNVCRQIREYLQDSITDVDYPVSVNEALDFLSRKWYCLAIIGFQQPGVSEIQVIRTLRQSSKIPIMAILEAPTLEDKVIALQSGADDVMTSPLEFAELLAQAQALIRRYMELNREMEQLYTIAVGGNLLIDPQYRLATSQGQSLQLTPKEFDLLYFLA